jgi:hyperosmotically inducible periplasmic protein
LKASPRVDVSKWGEFQQPETVAEVYRYYRVAPYFADSSNIPRPTDPALSSGNRASDETVTANRGSDGLNPTDQGNSVNDRQTTARIRKGVVADSTLSVAAKNVKIITVNGRVTLRGKVPTEAERKLIVELAESAAPGQVDDQLQVEATETKKY